MQNAGIAKTMQVLTKQSNKKKKQTNKNSTQTNEFTRKLKENKHNKKLFCSEHTLIPAHVRYYQNQKGVKGEAQNFLWTQLGADRILIIST